MRRMWRRAARAALQADVHDLRLHARLLRPLGVRMKIEKIIHTERELANEVVKTFMWAHPRVETTEVLLRKAENIRKAAVKHDIELARQLRRLNIDQLKLLVKAGMDMWEYERTKSRGWHIDPLHLLKVAMREAARREAEAKLESKVFEAIVKEIV